MKFKADENLGLGAVMALRDAGHDVETVRDESLGGAPDAQLAAHCASEDRVLVTLDLDFANPLRFPPARGAGYAVIRLPARPMPADLQHAVATLVEYARGRELRGRLVIVEPGRVREYQDRAGEEGKG